LMTFTGGLVMQEVRWPAINVTRATQNLGGTGGFQLFRTTETADRRPRASVLLCPLMTKTDIAR
jgi:hypothetical protein